MIAGLGHDLVEIERIRNAIAKFGDRFLKRVFTQDELHYATQFIDPVPHLAVRFAAKEAAAKALGVGIANHVTWHDFEITREAHAAPQLVLHARAAEIAREHGIVNWHLSLTHTEKLASGVVIAEGA